MKIKFKGIVHERYEDAPFIGALLVAERCEFNCIDCFNKHLINREVIISNEVDIIKEVKKNVFNEGVIFAGLEWSNQPKELEALIKEAKRNALKIIVYTGLEECEFLKLIDVEVLKNCYVKYGSYNNSKLSDNYKSYNVKLASTNQYIKYYME